MLERVVLEYYWINVMRGLPYRISSTVIWIIVMHALCGRDLLLEALSSVHIMRSRDVFE
jgi:hypothetical protein